jgi:hypothetical protein
MEIKLPGQIDHSLNFDDFRFEGHGFNYEVAKNLSSILLSTVDVDDLRGFNESTGQFDTTVGTGASMNWPVDNVSLQRTLLALHFSSYAQRRYSSCNLTIYEYYCLKNLLDEFLDDVVASHREQLHEANITLLKSLCQQFAKDYAALDPTFLMTILKETV